MDQLNELTAFSDLVWRELARAATDRRHPWRTPVLANAVADKPLLRTVVLRKSMATAARLRFYTDRRSRKWAAIENGASSSVLFYNAHKQLQLTVSGPTHDVTALYGAQLWPGLEVPGRAAYAGLAVPGEALSTPGNNLPDDFFDRTKAETDYAQANFAVFELVVTTMEVLQLHRAGHRRAVFVHQAATGTWQGEWVAP